MGTAMSELPLALFTTLAPAGAGAFVALALAFATTKFSDVQLKKIDRLTFIPVVVLLAGFICAFFHLANPLNSFGVFANVGASPLSNEIVAGVVFTLVAVVYLVLAVAGKLQGTARVSFAAVLAVLAVVFACFTGAAYMIETIAGWDSPYVIVQMIGFGLTAGMALGVLVLALAGALNDACKTSFKTMALVVLALGLIFAVAGIALQVSGVAGMNNALESGADLAANAATPMAVGIICLVVSAVLAAMALLGKSAKATAACAPVLAVVGVFACRLAFYAVQISVGLYIA